MKNGCKSIGDDIYTVKTALILNQQYLSLYPLLHDVIRVHVQ